MLKPAELPTRRNFLLTAAAAATTACQRGLRPASMPEPQDRWARFPGKVPMRLLTDRPPQLETPLSYLTQDLTPNEAFYVRWHLEGLPASVDLRTFRLSLGGAVRRPRQWSVDELRRNFEPVSLIAVNQCSGNSRSLFAPRVPGGQWRHGAIGNARWTGVRLRDLLRDTDLAGHAVDVSFRGLDAPPLPSVAAFVKSLPVEKALEPDLLVAYEMNGQPMPLLNGFPLRLVVPGWYATYWVKALNEITVSSAPFRGFWMDKAYRVPRHDPPAGETPGHLAEDTVPINRMRLRSLIVQPGPGQLLARGQEVEIQGVALDYGSGITGVEVSVDNGASWQTARLDRELGRYSWRRWRYRWTPRTAGPAVIRARARNAAGDHQVPSYWNHGGYMRNEIEHTEVEVA